MKKTLRLLQNYATALAIGLFVSQIWPEATTRSQNVFPQRTVTDLTDAQVKALPTTGISVIPAPGSGNIIRPLRYHLLFKSGATAYTNVNVNAFLAVRYVATSDNIGGFLGNDSTIVGFTFLTQFLTTTTGIAYTLPGTYYDDRGAVNGWGLIGYAPASNANANSAQEVYIDNAGSGNLTGGNAGNVVRIVAEYSIVQVP